jgi:hypothetical protein
MSQHNYLNEQILSIIHDLGYVAAISPSHVAEIASERLCQDIKLPMTRYAVHEFFKAVARPLLANKFEANSKLNFDDVPQSELFTGTLQERYPLPRKKDTEPTYKLLSALTEDEIIWNIRQLRISAQARLKHADALEAYLQNQIALVNS